jgi:hypothetical protein
VTIVHPALPGRRIEVEESAVRHHQASGWRVAEDAPREVKKTARRRQQKTGDET